MPNDDMSVRQLYDLLKKLQDDQTEKLSREINRNREEIDKKLRIVEQDIEKLKNNYLHLERKRRKNNIVVFGLQVDEADILNSAITALNLALNINIKYSDINNIYFVGKRHSYKKGILIEFVSYLTKQSIFKNISKLKGKKVTIAHDLCLEDQQKQKILVKHLKLARDKNKTAKIKGFKLQIEDKIFTAEELESNIDVEDLPEYTDADKELSDIDEAGEDEDEETVNVKQTGINKRRCRGEARNEQNRQEKGIKKHANTEQVPRLVPKNSRK